MILVGNRDPGCGIGLCLIAAGVLATACAPGAPAPADIRLGEDACGHCRMTIVSVKTAAQIVSPGAEPVFFDDLACLNEYLAKSPLAADAVAFVADHQTSAWIDLRQAVITRTAEQTPMGSGLVAGPAPAEKDKTP